MTKQEMIDNLDEALTMVAGKANNLSIACLGMSDHKLYGGTCKDKGTDKCHELCPTKREIKYLRHIQDLVYKVKWNLIDEK